MINIKFKVVELFAGKGAWSKALEKMGIDHEVVDAIEFDEKTMQCYNIIHNTSFQTKDITQTDPSKIGDGDIIFYSPPCQAFSVAGKQDGFGDPRGTLFFDAFRIIQSKRPKYAIMENVKGLVGKKFQYEFETMLQLLEQEGYRNYWKVLNAKDYGIPQSRDRVFIVSIRKDIDHEFQFPEPFDSGLRLRDLLEDVVNEKYYLSDDKAQTLLNALKNKEKTEDAPRELSFNGEGISYCIDANYWKGTSASNVNKGRRTHVIESRNNINQLGLLDIRGNEQVRRVYDPNGIAPTLNTMQGGNRQPKIAVSYSRKTGIGKELDAAYTLNSSDWRGINRNQNQNAVIEVIPYLRIRKLTPLECMRLMGFNDEDFYKLKQYKISDTQIYKMSGNSIVVDVIVEILKELLIKQPIHIR